MLKLQKLYESGSFDDLVRECRVLVSGGKADSDTINFLALAYKNLGEIESAVNTFKKGIKKYPRAGLLLSNLANIYRDNGALSEAVECLVRAIELIPDNPSLGLVLTQQGKLEEARESLETALKMEPNKASLRYNVANIYRKLEKLDTAIRYFEGVDIGLSQSHLTECLYYSGEYKKFIKKLDELNRRQVTDPLIGALTEHARITLNHEGLNAFCARPTSYIYRANIDRSGPTGKTLGAIRNFASTSESEYRTQSQQKLLTNGVQSPGNLLDSNRSFVDPLRKILESSVAAYRDKFSNSNEPFLKYWPKKYELFAWVIVVRKDGYLAPHIHKEGWLSGSLYLELPKSRTQNEAAISFGLHGANYPDMGKSFKDTPVQIAEGMVCMFPSSLFHKTVPFRSSQKRISLAFDVIPVR